MSRILNILLVAGAVVALVVLYFVNPSGQSFMPKCVLKAVTGYSCPGCGFQRAVHAALHGDFIAAANYNFFLLLGIPYLFSVIISDVILRGEARQRWQRVTHSRWLLLAYVITALIWWVVRNILSI